MKHHVQPEEVEEAISSKSRFRLVEKGKRSGEDVYMALGRTQAGRYLAVLFIYKKTGQALILSARYMARKERWQKVKQKKRSLQAARSRR